MSEYAAEVSPKSASLDNSSHEEDLPDQCFDLNELPLCVFAKILSYLDLNDKFVLVTYSEPIRLMLEHCLKQQHSDLYISNSYPSQRNRWWLSNDLISHKEDAISGFNFLHNYTMFNGCLRRVRFQFELKIGDLVFLQAFFSAQLEQLEIFTLVFDDQPVKIILHKLRVFYVQGIKNQGKKLLTLESPYLSHVYFGDASINCIQFIYPISIIYFEFDLDHSVSTLAQNVDILRLANARVIKCNQALNLTKEALHDLIVIPLQLSQLHLSTERFWNLSASQQYSANFQALFHFLLNHYNLREGRRPESNYCDLEIFLNGVQINRAGQVIEYHTFFDILLGVHFRNRELLSPHGFPYIQQVDYQILEQLTLKSFEFSFAFTKRYPNVCAVVLDSSNNAIHPYEFYNFLKECRGILKLKILYASHFDQEFYDQLSLLPSLRRSLLKFTLRDKVHIKGNKLKNFDFLVNFDYLRKFYCNQLNRAKVIKLLLFLEMRESRFPARFTFEFDFTGRLELVIHKKSRKEYDIRISDYVNHSKVQLADLTLMQLLELLSQKFFQDVLPHFLDFEETLKTVI